MRQHLRNLLPTERPHPEAGDRFFGCLHRPNPYASHLFLVDPAVTFLKPNKTTLEGKWIFLCDACFARHGSTPEKAPIGADGVWPVGAKRIQFKEPS